MSNVTISAVSVANFQLASGPQWEADIVFRVLEGRSGSKIAETSADWATRLLNLIGDGGRGENLAYFGLIDCNPGVVVTLN